MQQPEGVSMGLFGDILGPVTEIWNAEQNRDAAEHQQVMANEFTERMSNTQYQRMVQDLNKAGLSPMLAYSKTAASPSGSTSSGSTSISGPRLGESELREVQSEQAREQAGVLRTTQEVNTATAEKLRAETDMVKQETENKRLYPGLNEAQIKELVERAGQHGASAGQLRALMDEVRQTISLRKPEEQFKAENPTYSKYASPVMDALKTIFGGVGLLRGTSALPNATKIIPKGGR
jgi:hypothetical protein